MAGGGGGATHPRVSHGSLARWPLPAPARVLVLCTRLSAPVLDADEIAYALPLAEHQRLARFHRESDRQRSAIAHALVRYTLAAVHGTEPSALPIARTDTGKPYLPNGVHFSVTHSGDLVAAAFCREQAVGVDVEQVNAALDLDAIAGQMWHDTELAWWQALSPELRVPSFFALWTAKEAMLKAIGFGVGHARDVVMPVTPGVPFSESSRPRQLPASLAATDWQVQHVAHAEYPLSIAGNGRYPVTVHLV